MATVKFNKELESELSIAMDKREVLVNSLSQAEDAVYSAKSELISISNYNVICLRNNHTK